MRRIRLAIFTMLLLVMVMSVTAYGSNSSNIQSSIGISQNLSSATTSTSISFQEIIGMETSSMETEGDGITDGLMNDAGKDVNDIKDGMGDITGEPNTADESGTNNTTEAR